jgi:hypothetical protein
MNSRNTLALGWAVAAAFTVTAGVPAATSAATAAKKSGATAKPPASSSARTPESATTSKPEAAVSNAKAPAADMTLRGGEEGTVFRTLTVQGEDRIHIEVERPKLRLDMDPEKAPGLERGDVKDVLERTTPDLTAPLLGVSAREASPWVARPWLSHFPEGSVARVRPDVKGAERWRMVMVNARAESVAVYQGKGDPPREIAWDGRSSNGDPVLPGASYSYVFEARDKAGNKRNFVGEGFRVDAFRYGSDEAPVLLFTARELPRTAGLTESDVAPPIVAEAASVMNQAPAARNVHIEVTARSQEQASALAQKLARWMKPLVIGDPARVRTATSVQSDAPPEGAVKIAALE